MKIGDRVAFPLFICIRKIRAKMFGSNSQAWESEYQTWYDKRILELKKKKTPAN